jgi:hypothetical protein
MLLNILYYDQVAEAKEDKKTSGLSFGPLYITSEQVYLLFFFKIYIESVFFLRLIRLVLVLLLKYFHFFRVYSLFSYFDVYNHDALINNFLHYVKQSIK